mmetsp:Transcript_57446/g.181867  ORF Transcript_57446/g.181867 Transcript_57446/m.181867 type:complete len:284 (-) Transcript_57446:282-1133(-)
MRQHGARVAACEDLRRCLAGGYRVLHLGVLSDDRVPVAVAVLPAEAADALVSEGEAGPGGFVVATVEVADGPLHAVGVGRDHGGLRLVLGDGQQRLGRLTEGDHEQEGLVVEERGEGARRSWQPREQRLACSHDVGLVGARVHEHRGWSRRVVLPVGGEVRRALEQVVGRWRTDEIVAEGRLIEDGTCRVVELADCRRDVGEEARLLRVAGVGRSRRSGGRPRGDARGRRVGCRNEHVGRCRCAHSAVGARRLQGGSQVRVVRGRCPVGARSAHDLARPGRRG